MSNKSNNAPLTDATRDYVMNDIVWRADLPALLNEWETSTRNAPYRNVFVILRHCLMILTQRAIEINDPALNIIMLNLALYDGAHSNEYERYVAEQRKRILKQEKGLQHDNKPSKQ